jgi:hypothetical protein
MFECCVRIRKRLSERPSVHKAEPVGRQRAACVVGEWRSAATRAGKHTPPVCRCHALPAPAHVNCACVHALVAAVQGVAWRAGAVAGAQAHGRQPAQPGVWRQVSALQQRLWRHAACDGVSTGAGVLPRRWCGRLPVPSRRMRTGARVLICMRCVLSCRLLLPRSLVSFINCHPDSMGSPWGPRSWRGRGPGDLRYTCLCCCTAMRRGMPAAAATVASSTLRTFNKEPYSNCNRRLCASAHAPSC